MPTPACKYLKTGPLGWSPACFAASMSVSDCSFPHVFLPASQGSQPSGSASQPASGPESGWRHAFSEYLRGFWWFVDATIPITLAILALEVLPLLGVSAPTPGMVLLAAVAYSSFCAGWQAGLIATAIGMLYELLAFSSSHHYTYVWQDGMRVATFCASALTATMLVGIRKRRTEAAVHSLARNRAAESLAAETAHLQGILHQLPLGVLVSDAPSGEIVFANEKARSILGPDLKRIESIGYPCIYHASHGGSYSPHEWPWRRCVELRRAIEEEFLYTRADGRLVIIRARACPITDRDGRPIAVVLSISDVAENRRAANRSESALSQPQTLEPAPC
jgi:PAS domain S-box-containing protein